MLDDISIPQVDYFSDFESDDGGWEAAGFVRIQNTLPQTYRLVLISEGAKTSVQYIDLSSDNTADIPLDFENGVKNYVLVVTGTTRYTRQTTGYRFNFTP
jgi:immune inhibitor A